MKMINSMKLNSSEVKTPIDTKVEEEKIAEVKP